MRISKTLKVLSLVGLGIGTSVATQAMLGRISVARGVQVAPERSGVITTVLPAGAPVPPIVPPGAGPSVPIAAGYSMSKPSVTFVGDTMLVDAKVFIHDTRPNLGYVWAVHVFDAADIGHVLPLYEHWFEDRTIAIPEGEDVHPALTEALPFPLPPGPYRVIVGGVSDPGRRKRGRVEAVRRHRAAPGRRQGHVHGNLGDCRRLKRSRNACDAAPKRGHRRRLSCPVSRTPGRRE